MCGPTSESQKGSSGGCSCGCCGCGCGSSGGFTRHFWTDEEKKNCMESYKEQLTKELAALDECIQEGCC